MGVACQPPATGAGRLAGQLKAQGQEEGYHPFGKGLAIAKQTKVGGFVLEIDGAGAVVPCPFVRLSRGSRTIDAESPAFMRAQNQ